MAWWKWPLRFAIVAVALAIALNALVLVTPRFAGPFEYEGPLQYALKYRNFSALSKETLIRETEAYIRAVAGGDQMACLYVVACDGEHARLELVSDIAGWDLQAAKDRIWRRRLFSFYCPGRTTNFGLHLIPRTGPAGRQEIDRRAHARWSFSVMGSLRNGPNLTAAVLSRINPGSSARPSGRLCVRFDVHYGVAECPSSRRPV